jgi:hypothetical protein
VINIAPATNHNMGWRSRPESSRGARICSQFLGFFNPRYLRGLPRSGDKPLKSNG